MEAAPGILRRDYEKRRRRGVERQAPSLRTEWVGWRHLAFLHWTSHDHEWDPWGPPSRGGRILQPLAARKGIGGNCCRPQRQTPCRRHIMRLGCSSFSKGILRSLRAWKRRISAEEKVGFAVPASSGHVRGTSLPARR